MRCIALLCFSCALFFSEEAFSQEWWFWPKYTLGQKADNYPGSRIEAPVSSRKPVAVESTPLIFHGEDPTERILDFCEADKLPQENFSVELWIVNHVNKPVGALTTFKHKNATEEPAWLLGMYGRDLIYSLRTIDSPFANLISFKLNTGGWKRYWYHVVGTYDGQTMNLFVNGEKVSTLAVGERIVPDINSYELEIASYMMNEPYMDLGNLLKMLRIHPIALSHEEIKKNFLSLQDMVTEGKLFPNTFHFNAGPYLNNARQNNISILWETDRPADFSIEYGKKIPLDSKVDFTTKTIDGPEKGNRKGNIYEITLSNLDPETQYFYNVKAIARDGTTIESGLLTFATAVRETTAYSFAVIGDTEARPHINDQVCKLIWDERPNFIVNVGDLTDGGKENHKFEWNFEYFQGVTQLSSRIPVFPVAGNGEGDLYWYNQYHALPQPEGYYSFVYGNAEFFMLNSNKPEEFAPGGKQYDWLEEKLKKSTARWKFVAHHHAPYSADDDDYGDSWKGTGDWGDLSIRRIVPLYEKYDVDMVFFGHLHTYQRTLPIRDNLIDEENGVIYVQGGGGGGNLEDFAPSRAWFSAKTYRGHHYFLITIHGDDLNFKMYDAEGRLKDYLDIRKPMK